MLTPFDIWAPMIRAPFSGDVTQEITPRLFSPDIKGVAEVETRVQAEVASYGKQLGKVLEALQVLSAQTKTPLPEIDALVDDIDAVKARFATAYRSEAEAALDKLKALDETAWAEVLRRGDG
jgi:hypothetical protein